MAPALLPSAAQRSVAGESRELPPRRPSRRRTGPVPPAGRDAHPYSSGCLAAAGRLPVQRGVRRRPYRTTAAACSARPPLPVGHAAPTRLGGGTGRVRERPPAPARIRHRRARLRAAAPSALARRTPFRDLRGTAQQRSAVRHTVRSVRGGG